MLMCAKCGKEERRAKKSLCGTCLNAYTRKHSGSWPSEDAEHRRYRMLKYNHGITKEEYNLMFFRQAGVCAICGEPEMAIAPKSNGKRYKALAVDHNHETGEVRELLCSYCNQALGFIEKDRSRARKILKYLKKHDQ